MCPSYSTPLALFLITLLVFLFNSTTDLSDESRLAPENLALYAGLSQPSNGVSVASKDAKRAVPLGKVQTTYRL